MLWHHSLGLSEGRLRWGHAVFLSTVFFLDFLLNLSDAILGQCADSLFDQGTVFRSDCLLEDNQEKDGSISTTGGGVFQDHLNELVLDCAENVSHEVPLLCDRLDEGYHGVLDYELLHTGVLVRRGDLIDAFCAELHLVVRAINDG